MFFGGIADSSRKVDLSQVSVVAWDWYRTLSYSHLYQDILKDYPEKYKMIGDHLKDNPNKVNDWLNGSLSYSDINKTFASITGLDRALFDKALNTLISEFDVDGRIMPYVEKFKDKGYKQVIVVDNYEIWDEFFLPQYSTHTYTYFDQVYNTRKNSITKVKDSINLLKQIASSEKVTLDRVLFIDDNKEFTDKIKSAGCQVICHNDIDGLAIQLSELI